LSNPPKAPYYKAEGLELLTLKAFRNALVISKQLYKTKTAPVFS
jgi:hypothetical protein